MTSISIDWSSPLYTNAKVILYPGTGGPDSQPVLAKVQRHLTALSYPRISADYHASHSLDNPFIVQVFLCERQVSDGGVVSTVVFERCDKDLATEIRERIQRQAWWAEYQLLSLLEGLLEALAYAAEKGISHGNIRPENMFMSREYVKLGVFPQSIGDMGREDSPTLRNPPHSFLSPERKAHIFKGASTTIDPYRCDMYALGIVFIYMANLWNPSFDADFSIYDHARRCQHFPRLEEYLRAMTDPSPQNRPSYEELIKYMALRRNVVEVRYSYTPDGDSNNEKAVLPERVSEVAIESPRRNLDVNLCIWCKSDLLGFFSHFSSLVKLTCGHQCHKTCFREFLQVMVDTGSWERFYCSACSTAVEGTLISHYLGAGALETLLARKMKKCEQCDGLALLQELQCAHAACQQCKEAVLAGRKHCKVCVKIRLEKVMQQ